MSHLFFFLSTQHLNTACLERVEGRLSIGLTPAGAVKHWAGFMVFLLLPQLAAALPPHNFKDMTVEAGIRFHHVNGAYFQSDGTQVHALPESLGSGVVLFDFDGDSDLDLLFVNGNSFKPPYQSDALPALYENLGHWRFRDISKQSGLTQAFYGMGALAADYDGDGKPDLLFTTLEGLRLYRNRGYGRFQESSIGAGLHPVYWGNGGQRAAEWTTAAALFDADQDGDLDILTAHYVRWSAEMTTVSAKDLDGLGLRLWLQENGSFHDATETSGLLNAGKSLGLALWDFDDDGKLDVVGSNDGMENFYLHNLGKGHFEEAAHPAGIAYPHDGKLRAGRGVDIADYLNNGSAAIAIANGPQQSASLFKPTGLGQFRDDSWGNGLADPTTPHSSYGILFADMDLDGWVDLLVSNDKPGPPLQWLRNLEGGRFQEPTSHYQTFVQPLSARGLAVGDLDQDGDLDIVVTSNGWLPRLLRNDLIALPYLRVALKGRPPNTDAIGANIKLHTSKLTQQRTVRTGGAYLSQSELIQTFGLGSYGMPLTVEIRWPGGEKCQILQPKLNQTLLVRQAPKPGDACLIGKDAL